MLKKIVSFIFIHLLWPILREVLTDLLRQLVKAGMTAIKGLMRKWEKEELALAADDAQKAEIQKKYSERQADIDAMSEKLTASADKIVGDALMNGEKLRTELLLTNASDLQKLEAPKESPSSAG